MKKELLEECIKSGQVSPEQAFKHFMEGEYKPRKNTANPKNKNDQK